MKVERNNEGHHFHEYKILEEVTTLNNLICNLQKNGWRERQQLDLYEKVDITHQTF